MIRTVPASSGCPSGYHLCGASTDSKGRTWLHCVPDGKACPTVENLRASGITPIPMESDSLRASECNGEVCRPILHATRSRAPRLRGRR